VTNANSKKSFRRWLGRAIAFGAFCSACMLFGQAARPDLGTDAGAPALWTRSQVVHPEQLVARFSGTREEKPLIIHVGFVAFYRSKHIPGAIFAGPATKPEGLDLLRLAVKKISHKREVIPYCGCCLWDKCPNLRPAFRLLRELGFTQVLMLPTNFAANWIDKGYPIERVSLMFQRRVPTNEWRRRESSVLPAERTGSSGYRNAAWPFTRLRPRPYNQENSHGNCLSR
jgi:thiosulfate/3-mercaptopyruvate sulfurtransferase